MPAPFSAFRSAKTAARGLAPRPELDAVIANRIGHRDVHLHDLEPHRLLRFAPVLLVLRHGFLDCLFECVGDPFLADPCVLLVRRHGSLPSVPPWGRQNPTPGTRARLVT